MPRGTQEHIRELLTFLDWRGGALAVLAFGLLAVALTRFSGTSGMPEGMTDGSTATNFALLLAGLVGLVLFVRTEAVAAHPLVPLSLFGDRAFTGANIMTLFLYGALSGMLFLLPFDLIERRGLTATQVGLCLLPIGIIIGTLSRAAGAWADRIGPRTPLALGSMLVAVAMAGLAVGLPELWLGVLVPLVLMALGMSIVVAPLSTAVMNAAPDAQSGAASGVNNAASRLAALFAVAIAGATASVIFFAEIGGQDMAIGEIHFGMLPEPGHGSRPILEQAFMQAYGVAMWLAAGWALLAALIALAFLRPRGAR